MKKPTLRSLTVFVGMAFICLTIIGTVCGIAAWSFNKHTTETNAYFTLGIVFACLVSLCVDGALLYGVHTSNYRLFYPFVVWTALAVLINVTVAVSLGLLVLMRQLSFATVYVVPMCGGTAAVWFAALAVVIRYRALVMKERGVVLLLNEEE
uniref:Uncharacterized protein n=1 Tax=Plectus sambesii TaxID=2011161 RepID=A0A914XQZ9_9BILA